MRRVAEPPEREIALEGDIRTDERDPCEVEVERLDPALRAWLERGTVGAR